MDNGRWGGGGGGVHVHSHENFILENFGSSNFTGRSSYSTLPLLTHQPLAHTLLIQLDKDKKV